MIKDFKDIIQDYEDIVLEETQQLLAEIKEVQSNKYTIAKLRMQFYLENQIQGIATSLVANSKTA